MSQETILVIDMPTLGRHSLCMQIGFSITALRWSLCLGLKGILILSQLQSLLAQEVRLSDLSTQRTLILGDSITYGGQYVANIEAFIRLQQPNGNPFILNLGLPSETVSGLSEPGHAGGAFPRPDLHERLDRTLKAVKPQVVLACYGMNCGIYHPYAEDRFEAFKVGIRRLHDRVVASGARMVHLTPPVFDPYPIASRTLPAESPVFSGPYVGYDEVLTLYSGWLVAMRAEGWQVIDLHGPMQAMLNTGRASDPSFLLAGDGVHMNDRAHWQTARWVLTALGGDPSLLTFDSAMAMAASRLKDPTSFLSLIKQRQRLLCDAWLTHIGHLRPSMNKGLALDAAQASASELEFKIQALLP